MIKFKQPHNQSKG